MELAQFIELLSNQSEKVEFEQTMAVIDELFEFTPTGFSNGEVRNEAGQNNGSCKIFAFGLLQELSQEQTLACFGRFYREDVLQHPTNDDHQNIRNFITHGWDEVRFDGQALVLVSQ